MSKKQILLTNDDGINSPGLWAAAEALSDLGFVTVVAPREQSTGMGRSFPNSSDGRIIPQTLNVHGKEWTVYSVGGSPAQAVQHGIFEVMEGNVDLVVSGINYGLNIGPGITISGTVGAAMEAASLKYPAIAVSLETPPEYHHSYSEDINFKPASYFTCYFAQQLLENKLPQGANLIKVDVPSIATTETPWEITSISEKRFYRSEAPKRSKDEWANPGKLSYNRRDDYETFVTDSDVYTVLVKKHVSVTPITLNMTAPVDFNNLKDHLTK